MEHKIKIGDSNEITRQYFDSLLLELRYIDSVIPSTKLELYGESFSTPVMTAALSHLGKGMVDMAKGAFDANAVMWSGMGEDAELEAITATGAKTIKIIKPYADDSRIYKQIEHAEKCGALAVGIDIDHSFNHKGQFDNVLGDEMNCKSLAEIKDFVKATKLPFVIKGVLSQQDTYKCIEAGVKGIVVSHHHGIQDFAVPPLMILPKIAKVVDSSIPIFVDCCISSGMDVFKALALGATAVSVGRALMEPVKVGGAKGAQEKIQQMTEELATVMARTCSQDLAHIDSSVIWTRDF
jgi:4-hydroxymandelate oxidase